MPSTILKNMADNEEAPVGEEEEMEQENGEENASESDSDSSDDDEEITEKAIEDLENQVWA